MARNEPWSADEVRADVANYSGMLRDELAGRPYSKAERRRDLAKHLSGRSGPAIEFKRANISAVLAERGRHYVDGYKPRGNCQHVLANEVDRQLHLDPELTVLLAPTVDLATPAE